MRSRFTRKQSEKPFRAQSRGKTGFYKVFQSAAARKNKSLQASEKLSAAVWLKFYVWRRYSLNKENFLSVIKILFQARKRTYDARKDMRSRITRKQSEKPFGARQCEKTSCWAFIKATHALQNSKKLKNLLIRFDRSTSAIRLSGCNKAGKQALRAFCKAIRAL